MESPMKRSRRHIPLSDETAVDDTAKHNLDEHDKVKILLGDKKLFPKGARKRLGSSLTGEALHKYIEEKKKEDEAAEKEAAKKQVAAR